uniref:Uncharacterized protein n=1 Tax=Arundo donax TaxID=35708 RepID=A0A0A9FEY4_ARUDO
MTWNNSTKSRSLYQVIGNGLIDFHMLKTLWSSTYLYDPKIMFLPNEILQLGTLKAQI